MAGNYNDQFEEPGSKTIPVYFVKLFSFKKKRFAIRFKKMRLRSKKQTIRNETPPLLQPVYGIEGVIFQNDF